jgi:hypothetical protein
MMLAMKRRVYIVLLASFKTCEFFISTSERDMPVLEDFLLRNSKREHVPRLVNVFDNKTPLLIAYVYFQSCADTMISRCPAFGTRYVEVKCKGE